MIASLKCIVRSSETVVSYFNFANIPKATSAIQVERTLRINLPSTNHSAYAAHLCNVLCRCFHTSSFQSQSHHEKEENSNKINVCNKEHVTDEWTNVTPKILDMVGRNLHLKKDHPIFLIKEVIVQHFYATYRKARGPVYAVIDNLPPLVTVQQNFENLLIREGHVTRRKQDNYYINEGHLLRAHTSAHEVDLIKSGLNAFLTIGDVYRRDAIDATHFPVFHQLEGVRIYNKAQLFADSEDADSLYVFEDGEETTDKQSCHTLEASKLAEFDLKKVVVECMKALFGEDMQYRWVEAYFPFTHPSFELEIKYKDEWIEMLGSGILRQDIINAAGARDCIGWAFGLGLERLAMKMFNIPDIRYFWSKEESVLSQFRNQHDIKKIQFKAPISKQPAIENDISFWIPEHFSSNDLYDLVRNLDDDLVEHVSIVDEFIHPKSGRRSHCYRFFFRHPSRSLSQQEVLALESLIRKEAVEKLGVEGRW